MHTKYEMHPTINREGCQLWLPDWGEILMEWADQLQAPFWGFEEATIFF